MKKKIFILCLVFCFVSMLLNCAYAGNVEDMMKGEQDLVVLGSVKDIKDGVITVTVDHVLGKTTSDLTGTDIDVQQFTYTYCEEHSTSEFRSPIISDNIMISLNQTETGYELANSAYKVDSNEYASCKIIVHEDIREEDCVRSLLEATCYVRSNAKVQKFDFDEEGRIYAVYPQTAEQCVQVVGDDGTAVVTEDIPDTLPTVPPVAPEEPIEPQNDYNGIIALSVLVIGVLAGTAIGYLIVLKKGK